MNAHHRWSPFRCLQHLFAMFGMLPSLAPILFQAGKPATILLRTVSGRCCIFLFICKGKSPRTWAPKLCLYFTGAGFYCRSGMNSLLGGLCIFICGLLFMLVSIVKIAGRGWINVLFPPAAMGAISVGGQWSLNWQWNRCRYGFWVENRG